MANKFARLRRELEVKKENVWLRRAFRNAMAAVTEQQENAAELARALWLVTAQNGGEVRINEGKGIDAALGASMPIGSRLHSYRDSATGETVFVAVMPVEGGSSDEEIAQAHAQHGAEATAALRARQCVVCGRIDCTEHPPAPHVEDMGR